MRKRQARSRTMIAALSAAGCSMTIAAPAATPTPRSWGSWVLDCAETTCTLRHTERLFARNGITADLELRGAAAGPVPVIAVRGLPQDPMLSAAVAGGVRATLQLGNQPPATLACGPAGDLYLCAPTGGEAASLAHALPEARSVTIALAGALPGQTPTSIGKRTLTLVSTGDALSHLPTRPALAGLPAHEVAPQAIPRGWVTLLDRGLKAAGYPNGTADLSALLARFTRR